MRTLASLVFVEIGLLREGFLLDGEAEEEDEDEWEWADLVGEVDFGTGMGRTTATGLTAVGDWEPCEVWSKDTRRVMGIRGDSKLVSEMGELMGLEMSTKLP